MTIRQLFEFDEDVNYTCDELNKYSEFAYFYESAKYERKVKMEEKNGDINLIFDINKLNVFEKELRAFEREEKLESNRKLHTKISDRLNFLGEEGNDKLYFKQTLKSKIQKLKEKYTKKESTKIQNFIQKIRAEAELKINKEIVRKLTEIRDFVDAELKNEIDTELKKLSQK